ncbi:MAG: hypothetical protein COS84_08575, partial [Armatimonadetes bacterium CG07_land_8_20_14_0_80_40_9]
MPLLVVTLAKGTSPLSVELIITLILFNGVGLIVGGLAGIEKKEREKYQTLYEVERAINYSPLNQEELISSILEVALRSLKAKRGNFWLKVKEGERLVIKASKGVKENDLKRDKSVVSWVVENERPLILPKLIQGISSLPSILSVPLRLKEEVIGALEVADKVEDKLFNKEDEELLSAIADHLSLALEKINLYQEITELKNYAEEIVENVGDGIMVLDKKGKIITLNPVIEEFLKLSSEEAIGKSYESVLDKRLVEVVSHLLKEVRKRERVTDYQFSYQTEENVKFPLRLSAYLLLGKDGEVKGTIIAGQDLSEKRRLISLEELNRLKSEFVSAVSHEFRTPLTSIKGFISTLLSDTEEYFDKSSKEEFYQIVSGEAERLTRLIDNLLSVSQIESGEALRLNLKEIDLPKVLRDVVKVQKIYTDKHSFKISLPNHLPKVLADEDKLKQILTNLISNAVKYSPLGGTITIEGEERERQIIISVLDEGVGISEESIGRLFQKFSRIGDKAIQRVKGTGIGLYLVKYLVEMRGGKVWVESKEGVGSKFSF